MALATSSPVYALPVSNPAKFWAAGTQILWQYKSPRGMPWIDPMTVVRDDEDGLVAWLAAGTETLQARRPDGRDLRADRDQLFRGERLGVRAAWKHNDVLRIAPTGRPWSVWLFWDCGSGEFRGWYGNLESPHVRDGNMVLTRDHPRSGDRSRPPPRAQGRGRVRGRDRRLGITVLRRLGELHAGSGVAGAGAPRALRRSAQDRRLGI